MIEITAHLDNHRLAEILSTDEFMDPIRESLTEGLSDSLVASVTECILESDSLREAAFEAGSEAGSEAGGESGAQAGQESGWEAGREAAHEQVHAIRVRGMAVILRRRGLGYQGVDPERCGNTPLPEGTGRRSKRRCSHRGRPDPHNRQRRRHPRLHRPGTASSGPGTPRLRTRHRPSGQQHRAQDILRHSGSARLAGLDEWRQRTHPHSLTPISPDFHRGMGGTA
jgi:hypothetical protein